MNEYVASSSDYDSTLLVQLIFGWFNVLVVIICVLLVGVSCMFFILVLGLSASRRNAHDHFKHKV